MIAKVKAHGTNTLRTSMLLSKSFTLKVPLNRNGIIILDLAGNYD